MFYIAGLLISVAGLLLVIESTTRLISWAGGDGFTLALHERDATDEAITDLYRFHPFTGFVFKSRLELIGGAPGSGDAVRNSDQRSRLSLGSIIDAA